MDIDRTQLTKLQDLGNRKNSDISARHRTHSMGPSRPLDPFTGRHKIASQILLYAMYLIPGVIFLSFRSLYTSNHTTIRMGLVPTVISMPVLSVLQRHLPIAGACLRSRFVMMAVLMATSAGEYAKRRGARPSEILRCTRGGRDMPRAIIFLDSSFKGLFHFVKYCHRIDAGVCALSIRIGGCFFGAQ